MIPSNVIYKFIGAKVQFYRKKAGLTQSKLAEVVSLDRSSITNIENGRQKILAHTVYHLASALGIEPGNLLPSKNDIAKLVKPEKSELDKLRNKNEEDWYKTIKLKGQEELHAKEN